MGRPALPPHDYRLARRTLNQITNKSPRSGGLSVPKRLSSQSTIAHGHFHNRGEDPNIQFQCQVWVHIGHRNMSVLAQRVYTCVAMHRRLHYAQRGCGYTLAGGGPMRYTSLLFPKGELGCILTSHTHAHLSRCMSRARLCLSRQWLSLR